MSDSPFGGPPSVDARTLELSRQLTKKSVREASKSIGASYRRLYFDPTAVLAASLAAVLLLVGLGYGPLRSLAAPRVALPEVPTVPLAALGILFAAILAFQLWSTRRVPAASIIESEFVGAAIDSGLVKPDAPTRTFRHTVSRDPRHDRAVVYFRVLQTGRRAEELPVGTLDALASCFTRYPRLTHSPVPASSRLRRRYDNALVLDYGGGSDE
ncbi:MAG: hypothetical protein MR874_01575 [Coriobacteriaceae bacterium]|uniref:hypothetical protein n=1 Tax=Tractidigestivibacter sp. TaxID=2847320 RepID=UPI002A80A010|nr:hypothetical protein [Tractidigestivibacter sp.]MCI6274795.1 hypothetical protein [Coriobacteriaceae bacterium]MCI6547593.1 hypothetical protein [Coriobacteriaceae bacterium]MCI6843439.1 hypothetical protein [Coriobacteriaceae bacterium]MCI7438440.1 hypothetical protein [Coriobacteriaceae bacterium]MDD7583983.1 hypothetical protein [Coriobacteriaceae bacterium]